MATHRLAAFEGDSWNWLRISGWSGSAGVHLLALALLALPAAAPPLLRKPPPPDISIRILDPPAPAVAAPLPPEPQLLRRPRIPEVVRTVPLTEPVVDARPADPVTSPVAAPEHSSITPSAAVADQGYAANIALAYETIVEPRYPQASMRNGEHGTVLLRVLVGTDGLPQQVDIARSSGHPRLDRAAREAVQRWRFRPVTIDGVVVPASGLVPVAFNLDRG